MCHIHTAYYNKNAWSPLPAAHLRGSSWARDVSAGTWGTKLESRRRQWPADCMYQDRPAQTMKQTCLKRHVSPKGGWYMHSRNTSRLGLTCDSRNDRHVLLGLLAFLVHHNPLRTEVLLTFASFEKRKNHRHALARPHRQEANPTEMRGYVTLIHALFTLSYILWSGEPSELYFMHMHTPSQGPCRSSHMQDMVSSSALDGLPLAKHAYEHGHASIGRPT